MTKESFLHGFQIFANICGWITLVCMFFLGRWVRRLTQGVDDAYKLIVIYKEHIRKLENLIKSSVYVNCMIRGGRPIVSKAPEGMTLEEAQQMIDKIFLTVQFQKDGQEKN